MSATKKKARSHARRKGEDGWAGEWHRRTNRTTGTPVVLVDRKKAGEEDPDPRWAAVCVAHGTIHDEPTRRGCHLSGSHPEEWCDPCRELAEAGEKYEPEPEPFVFRITKLQAEEVEHGLSIDAETEDLSVWGEVEWSGGTYGKGTPTLKVWDVDGAIYRITSSRDICWDNAASESGLEASKLHSRGRSFDGLAKKILEAAGGPEAVKEDTRRWIEY